MTESTFPFAEPSPFLRTMILDTDSDNFGNYKWKLIDQIDHLLNNLNTDEKQLIKNSWPPPPPQTSSCSRNGPVPIQYHKPHAQFCPNSFPRKEFARGRRFVRENMYDLTQYEPSTPPFVRPDDLNFPTLDPNSYNS